MWFPRQPRQPLFWLSLCAIAGIVSAQLWPLPAAAVAPVVALLAALAWRSSWAAPGFVVVAFYCLHVTHPHERPAAGLAAQLSSEGRTLHVVGTAIEEPRKRVTSRGEVRFDFVLKTERVTIEDVERPCSVNLLVRWRGDEPRYGDRIELTGFASNLEPVRNPGQFDFATAMRRRGIFSEIRQRYVEDGRILARDRGNPIRAFALETRHWMERALSLAIEDQPDAAGLIRGMVLGSRADTPPQIEDLFRTTGTMHLFAVSGLNVAMFALIAWTLLKTVGVPRKTATPLLIALVAFYALLTGLSASGVRAAVMTGIFLGGVLADRPPLVLNSLGAAAFAILLLDTRQFFATGFQLSFAVVLAILLFANPIARRVKRATAPDPFLPVRLLNRTQRGGIWATNFAAKSIGVSIAAWIGSLLLNLHYFHLLSPWTVLANLFVVPLAFGVLGVGTLSLICAPISAWLTAVFNHANLAVMHLVLWTVKLFAGLPGSAVYIAPPEFGPRPLCRITVLDLGNGAAAHLHVASADWLIDCGSEPQYRWITRSYLRSRGVNRLDGTALTHGDIEHVGALLSLLGDFNPGTVVDSVLRDRATSRRAIQAHLSSIQRGRFLAMRGDGIPIAPGVRAEVLYPPNGVQPRVADDKALVLRLVAGKTRVLFMSDSGFFTERWLLDNEADLRSDILIKGQHSADVSGTAEFLSAVAPLAIVCTGADFPQRARVPEEWAGAVESRGIQLFRQDRTGAVTIDIGADGFSLTPFLGGQTFRSRSR